MRLLFRGQAQSLILDANDDLVAFLTRRHGNFPVFGIFYGVIQQIDEHVKNLALVADSRRQIRLDGVVDRQALFLGKRLEFRNRLPNGFVDQHLALEQLQLAQLDLCRVQKRIDRFAQLAQRVDISGQDPLLFVVHLPEIFVAQHLEIGANAGDRRTQLVRRERNETRLEPIGVDERLVELQRLIAQDLDVLHAMDFLDEGARDQRRVQDENRDHDEAEGEIDLRLGDNDVENDDEQGKNREELRAEQPHARDEILFQNGRSHDGHPDDEPDIGDENRVRNVGKTRAVEDGANRVQGA